MTPTDWLTLNFADYTIFIIDDNPQNLSLIAAHLHQQGFQVRVAQDGNSLLRVVANVQPDLILLDIMMPGLNGFETCQRLKANPATAAIPVIFMTALNEPENLIQAFAVGGVDYILKPFHEAEAQARIVNHLQIHRVTQMQNHLLHLQTAQTEQLAALNASKDKLFAILSHDLRTPFNNVMGHAEFLKLYSNDLSQTDILEAADAIYDSAQAANSLLNNLLTWARLQRDQITPTPKPITLRPFFTDLLTLFQQTAVSKQITLTHYTPPDLTLTTDPNLLQTLLRNLLSNALKFTPTGGTVTLTAQRQDETALTIAIQDNGLGIPATALDKLFHLDVHYTTLGTAQEKGTGLGLILCQEIAGQLNATLHIDSQLEHGTTVTCTIPITATVETQDFASQDFASQSPTAPLPPPQQIK